MITAINISNLRGIAQGKLALPRLGVLVGANGSGKSTLLEACLIGASPVPATAVGMVTIHRHGTPDGARWLIAAGNESSTITVELDGNTRLRREIFWDQHLLVEAVERMLQERNALAPYSAFRIYRREPPLAGANGGEEEAVRFSVVGVARDNQWASVEAENDKVGQFVRLVEPRSFAPLHDLFSQVVQAGRRSTLLGIVKSVMPDLEDIEILTDEGWPRLYLVFRGERPAIPATLGGDGVQAMLRTAFEVAAQSRGTLLVEEPEVHQHPFTLRHTSDVLVAAARRGCQVLITTHSLELVENILASLNDEEIVQNDFAEIIKMRLDRGQLSTTKLSAKDAERLRTELGEDLR